MNSFVPAFNAGVMVFDQAAEERFTWAIGGFAPARTPARSARAMASTP